MVAAGGGGACLAAMRQRRAVGGNLLLHAQHGLLQFPLLGLNTRHLAFQSIKRGTFIIRCVRQAGPGTNSRAGCQNSTDKQPITHAPQSCGRQKTE